MSDLNEANRELTNSFLSERRSDRRWKNVRFCGWMFILLLYAILIFMPNKSSNSDTKKPYVSLVRLNGVIMSNTNFSSRKVLPQLAKAFKDKKSKGVVLVINSPGGSPVQASIIHDKIIQLKEKYKKKVVVVGQDVLASGAYLVATAADKIYVHPDTLTGSIGVIMSGFGFTGAIQKVGITRRVFTAGPNKDRLDPFKPMSAEDKTKIQNVLDAVHQNFIMDVVHGRQNKLQGDTKEIFSGDFWTGSQAVKLGLADGTGNLWTIIKKEFKVSHYKNYSVKRGWFDSIFKSMETRLNIGMNYQSSPIMALYQN